MIDDIDITILDILQKNGRTRRNDLAQTVGLSIPSISERLKKLEENGVIKGFFAELDPKKVGKDITAFIKVSVDKSKHYQAFIEQAKLLDEVLEIHAITGDGSHLLKVRTENTSSLEKLLSKIQAWNGVTMTSTSLVLSTHKETLRLKISKK
ncbi:MAG: Lrp/AsnC family transcriptional regulator [Bacteroidetes bacterium]|nr:Lrp/AsnC family transcriptional regulator [Bacteroidota bacterium]